MAMLYALLLMVVVVGIGALMFARTIAEIQHSGDDAAIVQTLLLARGAANLGGQTLQKSVRNELQTIVEATSSTTGRWSFGSGSSSSTEPTSSSVITALSTMASTLQSSIDTSLCSGGTTFSPTTGGTGTFRVYFTGNACGVGLPSGVGLPGGRFVEGNPRAGTTASAEQTYALPFVMVAEGNLGTYRRNVVLQGEYRFMVGRGSFAKYALFTNVHRMNASSDSEVWFTDNTLFDGPVHTNNFFRYYRNSWFGGKVTSAGCGSPGDTACSGSFNRRGAEFYGRGFVNRQDMNPNESNPSYTNRFGTHAPDINEVDWRAGFVPLPANNQDQEAAASANGLHFGSNQNLYSLTVWAGDASEAALTPDGSGGYTTTATYQYIRSCTSSSSSSCTTYRYDSTGALYRKSGSSTWTMIRANFNGVLYVDGDVSRFTGPARVPSNSSNPDNAPPALAAFAQLTLAADDSIRISGDLKYENPPCSGVPVRNSDGTVTPATCANLDALNVLGVFTQDGNVQIGNYNSDGTQNAPENVAIHAVLMTSRGRVEVEDYNRGSARGAVNLMGGIIENYYGAFGTFNASSGVQGTGYDRKFTYDQRMSLGIEPPYFPTVTQDSVRDVIVFSYGQREQIY